MNGYCGKTKLTAVCWNVNKKTEKTKIRLRQKKVLLMT